MEKWRGKVAIVTGASSGIGAATARALATRGLTVVALARREDRLQELVDEMSKLDGAGKVYPRKADVRKEEDIKAAFDWVESELGGPDVMVNNAGVYCSHYLSDGTMEEWRDMLDVNVLAVALFTKLFLKSMERRNSQNGHIININSMFGHLAEYSMAGVYCGSKHAARAIAMCLRRELAEKNSTIKVTNISPGMTATDILKDRLGTVPMLESSDVAAAVVDALSASPASEICEVIMKPSPSLPGVTY